MSDQEKLEAILSRCEGTPEDLIPVLHDLQDEYHYLPRDGLKAVAGRLKVPLTQVFSVATFFKGFHLEPLEPRERRFGDPHTQFSSLAAPREAVPPPPGVHHVRVCQGTACHLHGSPRLQEGVVRRLGIEPGQTSSDGQFSLERVKCVGKCGAAPVLAVDQDFFGEVGVDTLTRILKPFRKPK